MIDLLRAEKAALQARNWDRVGEIAAQKEALVPELLSGVTKSDAAVIERLAAGNERMLRVMRDAAISVSARIKGISQRAKAVGYGAEGDRLSVDDAPNFKRV